MMCNVICHRPCFSEREKAEHEAKHGLSYQEEERTCPVQSLAHKPRPIPIPGRQWKRWSSLGSSRRVTKSHTTSLTIWRSFSVSQILTWRIHFRFPRSIHKILKI